VALRYFFNPNFWFRTPDATPTAGESRLALRFFVKKFAPAVSIYSSQGHFGALKPQAHNRKYLTAQNAKVENTPQRQPENNTSKSHKVGLVHKTKTKIILKVVHACFLCGNFGFIVGSAHLRISSKCRILDKHNGICCIESFFIQEVP
jgi:hypothetical protein